MHFVDQYVEVQVPVTVVVQKHRLSRVGGVGEAAGGSFFGKRRHGQAGCIGGGPPVDVQQVGPQATRFAHCGADVQIGQSVGVHIGHRNAPAPAAPPAYPGRFRHVRKL